MSTYFQTSILDDGCLLVAMDDPSGRTNRTTDQFKAELDAVLAGIEAAPELERPRGLIFTSVKSSFCVGGDVGQILAHADRGLAASFADSMHLKALFRRIELLGIPSVACISGAAVGGGFELALACHARFCLPDPAIKLGLPEVALKLVPGGGGMLRLVHMLGIDKTIALVADGRLLAPSEADGLGLLTALVETPEQLLPQARAWIVLNGASRRPWDERGHRVPGGTLFDSPRRYIGLQARAAGAARGKDTAATIALSCIAEIAASGFADGAVIESRAFARLACGRAARAAIGLRFLDRATARRSEQLHEAPEWLGAALKAAFLREAGSMLAEGVPHVRVTQAALRAGYPQALVQLVDGQMEGVPASAANVVEGGLPGKAALAALEQRFVHAQLAKLLQLLATTEPVSAATLNLAAVEQGLFPAWTGGPIRLAIEEGPALANTLEALAGRHGDRFLPPADVASLLAASATVDLA